MAPRFTHPDARIDAVRGCVAVERGPLVFALESADVPGVESVDELRIDAGRPPRLTDGRVTVRCRRGRPDDHDWPYRTDPSEPATAPGEETQEVPLVEYHAWANRGPSTMRVWLPTLRETKEDAP